MRLSQKVGWVGEGGIVRSVGATAVQFSFDLDKMGIVAVPFLTLDSSDR